jgi:hypothetical protein
MASPVNSVSNPRRFLKFAKYESAMNDVISAIRKSHFGKSIDEDFLQSLKILTESKMVAADVIKRPESIMDNALLRFPHLGESIFEELDNESLAKSREVCDFWKIFIDDQKLPWIRMIKRHIKFLDPWQELIKISSVETLQEMACTVHQYYIENDIKCPQGTKITYLDCPRNPYKRTVHCSMYAGSKWLIITGHSSITNFLRSKMSSNLKFLVKPDTTAMKYEFMSEAAKCALYPLLL